MRCANFERRLHEVLDERGRPEEDSLLQSHARTCAGCRQMLAAQQALWGVLAHSEIPPAPAGLLDAILREAAPQPAEGELLRTDRGKAPPFARPHTSPSAWRLRGLVAATAAAVLLAGLLAGSSSFRTFWAQAPHSAPIAQTAAPALPNPTPPPIAASSSSAPWAVSAPPGDPPRDPAAIAREERFAEALRRWQMRLPEWGDTLGLTDADAPTVQGAAAVSEITGRLRSPLSASLQSTLNVLRTALPSAEENPTKPQARRILRELDAVA